MGQKLIFTNTVGKALDQLVEELGNPTVFVVTDDNAAQFVLPLLQADSTVAANAKVITFKSGDINKDINQLQTVWAKLNEMGATRSSLVINVGGGVVTDLGGFAAASFKRGVRFINVPTTLLGAVDAAVGGKTGINFNGFKNEIGAFKEAEAVIISTVFFNTLPQQELLSGYAEMLKHGLLEGKEVFARLLNYSVVYPEFDSEKLLNLLRENVAVKQRIVAADPTEKGLRKCLNLGHTAGHAFESFALKHREPIPHGYAVAWGLVVDLVLSHMEEKFPSNTLHTVAQYISTNYGAFSITCDDYPALLEIMSHDKKNASPDAINFTLLKEVGDPIINCTATPDEIKIALDIYRDLMHLA
jgi:3-dehydroquinate synthase